MYDFYKSDVYLGLYSELVESYELGDIEDACDIFMEIEQERVDFESKLPDWYKLRWSNLYLTDPATYKEVMNEYKKNIYDA